MSSLEQRLLNLERLAVDAEPPVPAAVIFCKGAIPDQDEQRQIDHARANGQHAVIFTIRDGKI